jgi:beta-lactamase class D/beta-lactamase regulating signal transducer with metallopeptidase domain
MTPLDVLLCRLLLATGGCLAAGLLVWTLMLLLRRMPGFQLQRSAWLLGQATVLAVFLVIALPHSERLRIVPPIELAETSAISAPGLGNSAGATTITGLKDAPDAASPALSWLAYVARIWLIVYLLGLAYAAGRMLRAQRLLLGLARAGLPLAAPERHAGFAAAQVPAALEVIEVNAPISPMLFGLFRPRLLLPLHLRGFDATQQQMIIEHELTHLRRHDLRWMSASVLLQIIFWFNPFMRMLRNHLCWAQELGCDRDVLAGRPKVERQAYAAALVAQLKSQRMRQPRAVNAALAFGGVSTSSVAVRIALIREPGVALRGRLTRIAAFGGLGLVFAGSFAFQPALAWRIDPLSAGSAQPALQSISCTELVDAASGTRLAHEGQCDERVTPASTFNIVVSLMGYDSGILVDEHTPALPFKPGYADWNASWRATTDPTSWIENSVVWYAQQVTASLGAPRFERYVQQFNYGNQDVSGDAGKNNGLALSWISSSLKISPVEQATFLRNLVNRKLPVSAKAYDMTSRIMLTQTLPNGWKVFGKTGTANPVLPSGKDDETRQYGWYVGWAKKGERTVVFARLVLDDRQATGHAGPRVKEAFLRDLPRRLDAL